jgi:hypothetical protein
MEASIGGQKVIEFLRFRLRPGISPFGRQAPLDEGDSAGSEGEPVKSPERPRAQESRDSRDSEYDHAEDVG